MDNSSAVFPDDTTTSSLYFTNEDEYLVRSPDAVVPEFIIQVRIVTPPAPLTVNISVDTSIPAESLGSDTFEDFIYSAAFDSGSLAISAFPFTLPPSDRKHIFFSSTIPSAALSSKMVSQQASNPDERQQQSPETVLSNCARQKGQMRENLLRIERLFWTRARGIWKEEGIRSGVKMH
ncbi:unnamed protein product [Phytophthora fragariaefolia]|uniref:Unnamed protein product n=1 Tax=Phytophthora fragariaefolia TaxID=1490495 RepID=A0A9W7D5V6_9STRA|nr:unnamed protein product [Phytophthora fragariaefolia]